MKKIIKNKRLNNQKGFSLIMALLVASLVLVISLAISSLMISEIKMVGSYDDSVTAYYAADAGIEYSLLQLKDVGYIKQCPDLYQENLDPTSSSPSFAVCQSVGSTATMGSLTQDQSAEVDLTANDRPNTIYIEWNSTSTGSKNCATEWTLITYEVLANGSIDLPPDNIDKGYYNGSPNVDANGQATGYSNATGIDKPSGVVYYNTGNPPIMNIYSSPPPSDPYANKITINLNNSGNKQYRYKLRFKCLACTDPSCSGGTYGLNYQIKSDVGTISSGVTTISSTGNSHDVKRKIEVDVNLAKGLNGIFDYVLYSDQPLNKPSDYQ